MIGRLLGLGRRRGGELGPVCPGCGRYDWPEQPTVPVPCRCGGHVSRSCSDRGCGVTVIVPEPGPDCD